MINVRSQFPQLSQQANGHPLTYLDSGATTLKPKSVIDRLSRYYSYEVSNVHRGAHFYSNQATENYEGTRSSVANFLNCKPQEVVFTSGTTDSINLVASSFDSWFSQSNVKVSSKTEIVVTEMEHHSNIVPWYMLAKKYNLLIKTIPFDESGDLDLSGLDEIITDKTLLVSMVHMSNVFGTVNPIEHIIAKARSVGAFTFVDAAQSVSFLPIDVQKLQCDFLTFSSHKLFGPEGLGVLYGKIEILDQIPEYRGGGSMISTVEFDKITYLPSPQKFEAGTPNIGAVIAFAESLKFFQSLDYEQLQRHEHHLLSYCGVELSKISGFKSVGSIENKKNILSFNIEGIHPGDIGSLVDQMGVAIRVGHHCAQPLLKKMSLTASIRASFSVYNNIEDCDRFVRAIEKAVRMLND